MKKTIQLLSIICLLGFTSSVDAFSNISIDTNNYQEQSINEIIIKTDAKGKYITIKNFEKKNNSSQMLIQKYKALPIVKDMLIDAKNSNIVTFYFDKNETDAAIKKFAKSYLNQ